MFQEGTEGISARPGLEPREAVRRDQERGDNGRDSRVLEQLRSMRGWHTGYLRLEGVRRRGSRSLQ